MRHTTINDLVARDEDAYEATVRECEAAQADLEAEALMPNRRGFSATPEARAEHRALSNRANAAKARMAAAGRTLDEIRGVAAEEVAMTAAAEVRNAGAERPSYDAVARVGAEARTYTELTSRTEGRSFFVDAYQMNTGDFAARQRVERHMTEARVEGQLTERAVGSGGFAGLVVPQYVVEQAALLARASRPFAETLTSMQIPDQGMNFLIPQGTTGTSAAEQATENSAVSNTDSVFANINVPVVTVAGQQDVSRQSLERGTPGLDQLLYQDLAAAYSTRLDFLLLNGSGASGQPLGLLSTAGINTATAFGAPPTAANFQTKIAGQVSAILGNRFAAPTALVVSPRRWAWLLGLSDASGRPLVTPPVAGPYNASGVYDTPAYGIAAGTFMGLPVTVDASVPTTVGTNVEDVAVLYRPSDLCLWEDGDGMPQSLKFEQTTGGSLTTKLVVYGYAAFTAARYPKSIGRVGGVDTVATQGLVAPTF